MTIRVSIIGYGLSGKIFHGPLIKSLSDFEVTAIVSSRVRQVAEDFPRAENVDFKKALEQSDLVIIATPHEFHFEQTKQALIAGKHVVVEKPFVATIGEANELFDIAKKKNLVLAIFHNRRFDADFLTLKKIVQNKLLGDIVSIESHFDRFRPQAKDDAWREKEGAQSGVWWDLGPHLIDQAHLLLGRPQTVSYDIGTQRDAIADDFFDVTFKYEKGVRFHLRASCVVKDFGFRFRVHGTKGSAVFLSLDNQESQLKSGMNPKDSEFGEYPLESFKYSSESKIQLEKGDWKRFYQEVINSIKTNKEFFVSKEDVLFTTSVLGGKKTF